MFTRARCYLFAFALGLTLARPVAAQQTVDVGSIGGRVVDQTGAAIPGASVQATHAGTNIVASAVTDVQGRFRLPYLKIGAYEVTVTLAGFSTVTRNLTVAAGSAFEVPISLTVAGLESTLMVTAEAPVIESARSQIASTVLESEVAALPNDPSRATASRARRCRSSMPSHRSGSIIETHCNWIGANRPLCRQWRHGSFPHHRVSGADRPAEPAARRRFAPARPAQPALDLGT